MAHRHSMGGSGGSAARRKLLLILLGMTIVGSASLLGLVNALRAGREPSQPPASRSAVPTSSAPAGPTTSVAAARTSSSSEGLDAFMAALEGKLPREGRVRELLAQRAADPRDVALALEKLLRDDGLARLETARLLGAGLPDDARLRFQVAQTLARRLDPESEALLLAGLADAPDAARPDLVMALRGSKSPAVGTALVERYRSDREAPVRHAAAFALADQGRLAALSPAEQVLAREQARKDLLDPDPRAITAGADVLGATPLDPADRTMLEGIVRSDPTPARRTAAFRALATSGLTPAELAPLLAEVAADPNAPEELRRALEGRGE